MKKKSIPILAAGAIGAGVATVGIGAGVLFYKTVKRPGETDPDIIDEFADREKFQEYMVKMAPIGEWIQKKEENREFEHIYITAPDGIKLHAFYLPAGEKHEKMAIIHHGFTSKAMDGSFHIKAFHEMGYDVLALDLRAHGESEGKYVGFGILDRFDTLEWIRYVRERFGKEMKIILHGTSMGATTALMCTGVPEIREEISAVIADCAFTSPDAIFSHVMKKNYHLPPFLFMPVSNMFSRFLAGYKGNDYSTLQALADNDTVPVLFLHGSEDKFVPTWMTEENYEACRTMKDRLVIEGAGHGSSPFEAPELYVEKEKEFLDKVFA